jgi:Domain of unknown function DUF29
MTTEISSVTTNLYAQDYQLWLLKTIEQLRLQQLSELDVENLIEELERIVRNDRRVIQSLLTRLFEYLIKLTYWESVRAYNDNHWCSEITIFRSQIQDLLDDSPSLKLYLEAIFPDCYTLAVRSVASLMEVKITDFPPEMPMTKEQVLDEQWLPIVSDE